MCGRTGAMWLCGRTVPCGCVGAPVPQAGRSHTALSRRWHLCCRPGGQWKQHKRCRLSSAGALLEVYFICWSARFLFRVLPSPCSPCDTPSVCVPSLPPCAYMHSAMLSMVRRACNSVPSWMTMPPCTSSRRISCGGRVQPAPRSRLGCIPVLAGTPLYHWHTLCLSVLNGCFSAAFSLDSWHPLCVKDIHFAFRLALALMLPISRSSLPQPRRR